MDLFFSLIKAQMKRLAFVMGIAVTLLLIGKTHNHFYLSDGAKQSRTGAAETTATSLEATQVERESRLAAGLDDPTMAKALAQLQQEGQIGLESDEVRMTFSTAQGDVTLNPFDLARLNARYRDLLQPGG